MAEEMANSDVGKRLNCTLKWYNLLLSVWAYMLFSIITLFIGSFYAAKRLLQYLSNHVFLGNYEKRFTFNGSAVQLFLICLLFFGIYMGVLAFMAVYSMATLAADSVIALGVAIVVSIGIMPLIAYFIAKIIRWGVEGLALEGSTEPSLYSGKMFALGWRVLGYGLLWLVSFGLTLPFICRKLLSYVYAHSNIAGLKLVFDGNFKNFPKKIYYLIVMIAGIGSIGFYLRIWVLGLHARAQLTELTLNATPEQIAAGEEAFVATIPAIVAGSWAYGLAGTVITMIVTIATLHWLAQHSYVEEVVKS
ncbi:MAG: YjgN family protein [Spirochaetaceae bacterium]|nr:YjgN family protein [Spirochaetaceae bacterium]